MTKVVTLFLFLFINTKALWSVPLQGLISDINGNPIPYANLAIKGTTIGTSSNIKGHYFLELLPGSYEIVFSALGYELQSMHVNVPNQALELNVVLQESVQQLHEIVVEEDREDPAYAIIRKAIKNRQKNHFFAEQYTCDVYIKSSLEKEYLKKLDSNIVVEQNVDEKLTKEQMNFFESYSTFYFKKPNQSKQIVHAQRDLSDKKLSGDLSVSVGFGDPDRPRRQEVNLNLFKTKLNEAHFNFYDDVLDLPSLSEASLVSPLHSLSTLSYKFALEEYFFEDGFWVNKIKVTPKNSAGPLFSGYIYIVDSLWAIKALDFEINPASLSHFKYFKVFHQYRKLDEHMVLVEERFLYDTKEGRATIFGSTIIDYSHFNFLPTIEDHLFGQELSLIEDQAFEHDSSYWNSVRTVDLKIDEFHFIHTMDSIDRHHKSVEYLQEQDSIENKLKWWEIAFGFNFQNSVKKEHLFMQGVVTNILMGAFGVGGYRQRLDVSASKEFQKGHKLSVSGLLNYGFTNRDLKGNISVSYTYLPKKFGRWHLSYADEYGFINGYQAIATVFSMGNYVNNIGYTLGHEMEFFNGFFVDATLEYLKVRSLKGLQYSQWSNKAFEDNNKSLNFNDFNKFSLEIDIKYTPFQKYATEPYKKVNLGSKYPTFALKYKRGMPGVIESISNYEFIEFRAWDNISFGSMGDSKWKLYTGQFLRSSSLLFTENKFFRQSDVFFFSDPMRSFQLLDTAINTMNVYVQAHYLHRFNGFFFNKIPLVKHLKLMEVCGAGYLWIQNTGFQHYEIYGGLEKPININKWNMRFKIGAYYVASYGTYKPFSNMIKFGIDFFDPFSSTWGY